MKILFVADNFPPEVNAPASRIFAHCKRWAEVGHEVTVITTAPNFPAGRLFEGYRNRFYQRTEVEGINLIRVWSYIAPNEGFFARTLDFLSFALSSFLAGLFQRTDIILTSSPQFFVALSANSLAFVKRKPWVFEVRDLWPESIVAVGMLQKGWLYTLLEALELHFYRSAAAIIIVSEGFRKSLVDRGISGRKIFTIPNGAELADFAPTPRDKLLAAKLGMEGRFVVGYLGTHGLAHGLDLFLDCAPILASEGIHILLVGDGARKDDLVARARAENIQNITFMNAVPRERVPSLLALCDAALVNLIASRTFQAVIPSKIFEAAALGCPILIGVDGVARELVEKYHAGLFYEPENRDAFVAAAMRLKADPVLHAELQAGCQVLAKAYDRTLLADHALAIVSSCARSAPSTNS